MKKIIFGTLLVLTFFVTSCDNEEKPTDGGDTTTITNDSLPEDPMNITNDSIGQDGADREDACERRNEGFIVILNGMSGIDAAELRIEIDGDYVGNVAPGAESIPEPRPAGGTYEIKATSVGSGATFFKKITVDKCIEDVVKMGK
mgnify:CR=1 FL=1